MFLLYTKPHRLSNTHESMLGNKLPRPKAGCAAASLIYVCACE